MLLSLAATKDWGQRKSNSAKEKMPRPKAETWVLAWRSQGLAVRPGKAGGQNEVPERRTGTEGTCVDR